MSDRAHPARDIPSLAETVSRIDDLTAPGHWRPSPAVAARIALDATWTAYQAGRADAIRELRTVEDAAADMGVSVQRIRQIASARGIGWRIGRDILFRPEDIAAMRDARRPAGRPKRNAP